MRPIKVGYVFILSFLLFLVWSMYMVGAKPLSGVPKPPKFPTYSVPPLTPQPTMAPLQTYDYPTPTPFSNGTTLPAVTPTPQMGLVINPTPQAVMTPVPISPNAGSPIIQSVKAVTQSIGSALSGKATTSDFPYTYQDPYNQYTNQLAQYDTKQQQYQKDLAIFTQNRFIPLLSNTVVVSLVLLVVVAIIGIILGGLGFSTLGSGYIFSVLWGFVGGPVVFTFWYVRNFPWPQADYGIIVQTAPLNFDTVIYAAGFMSLVGVIILTIVGLFFLDKKLQISLPKGKIRMPQMSQQSDQPSPYPPQQY